MEEEEGDHLEKRRRQIREASKRLRKRRRDQQTAMEAEVAQLRALVDQLRAQLHHAHSELAVARMGTNSSTSTPSMPGYVGGAAAGRGAGDVEAEAKTTTAALLERVKELEAEVAQTSAVHKMLQEPAVARFVSELYRMSAQTPVTKLEPEAQLTSAVSAKPSLMHLDTSTASVEVPVHEEGQRMGEWLLMEAAQVQLPLCECPKLEPVAIVDEESLKLAAVDALHHVTEFLSQGWSQPTQVFPGLMFRTRNVGKLIPARCFEFYSHVPYDAVRSLMATWVSGTVKEIAIDNGMKLYTAPLDDGHNVSAEEMARERRLFGRRTIRAQSGMHFRMLNQIFKMPPPWQDRDLIVVGAVQELMLSLPKRRGRYSLAGGDAGAAASGSGSGEEATPTVSSSFAAAAAAYAPRVPYTGVAADARGRRPTGRVTVLATQSVLHPSYPEKVESVRAHIFDCCIVEELEGGGVHWMRGYSLDFRGELPAGIMVRRDASVLGSVLNIDRVAAMTENFGSTVVPTMGAPLAAPPPSQAHHIPPYMGTVTAGSATTPVTTTAASARPVATAAVAAAPVATAASAAAAAAPPALRPAVRPTVRPPPVYAFQAPSSGAAGVVGAVGTGHGFGSFGMPIDSGGLPGTPGFLDFDLPTLDDVLLDELTPQTGTGQTDRGAFYWIGEIAGK
eukprot:CAMPEP_0196769552 /NCGR_PEP_ID=MMETSP1104-20130614/608_1 /TAXON_ID=33652 /ORGANISM="Cafeteria sp., Strain Caron Lab Isolate" /LENGTH=674 /DNA_ID=CAMNT_0042139647 /DNA_START=25 /DNA_END=2049 /DNA_ORIENTATION=+